MNGDSSVPNRLYHLALRDEWRDAVEGAGNGTYRRSTLGRSLAEEGFIHCSFAHQVQTIADLVYRGRSDVVLLVIKPSELRAEVRVESPGTGADEYPHIYGPIPVAAVIEAIDVPIDRDGHLSVRALIDSG